MDTTDSSTLSWDDYIRPVVSMRTWFASRRAHVAAFDAQRRLIRDLLAAHRPRRVVCLGAGYLNDLPVDALLAPERENFWVDWIAGASVEGVRGTTIGGTAERPACLFCACPNPRRYCAGFVGPVLDSAQVCSAFGPVAEPSLHCARYAPGDEPAFLVHDVTAGRAARFARRAERIVRASAKPE